MKTSKLIQCLMLLLAAISLAAIPVSSSAQTIQCVETNGVKFVLLPNVDGGLDVKDSRQQIVLADDFYCNTIGPISDIHIWGSWLSDNHGLVTNFWIGIYDDVPAFTNFLNGQILPSHPGTNLLWQQTFGLGQYAESPYATGSEYFYNPTNNVIMGGDTQAWYYCFYPTNPFIQQGTATQPTNYWLAVRAQLNDQTTLFGWKSAIQHYNDAAVWGTVSTSTGLPLGNWQSMTNPITQQRMDLSFKLTTPTNSIPTNTLTQCIETNGVKYAQFPNANNGVDVWNNPYALADDFICTNAGPITDIHIWGSWLNNQVATNTLTFWLAIYDDVPVDAANTNSHPGRLLWQQWFSPGQYAENLYGFGSETFLDPGPPVTIGNDQQIWYYCFYPTNPLVQVGTFTAPKTYWLVAYAQLPAGTGFKYGWKSTPTVQHDISVHTPWTGTPPVGNPWVPTYSISAAGGPGTPLDLAFKITTPTNKCAFPVPVACPTDKTVECGSNWAFDPPLIGPDQCCPSNPIVTFSTVTNILGPCQQAITRTWNINDCVGFVGICSQTVTVIDTTPPVFTSFPTNLVAFTCNTNAQVFWSITATDACSSVTITSTPPSGFFFPAHSTNNVNVLACDGCGNCTNKSFTVTMQRLPLDKLYIRYLATNRFVLNWTNGILQCSIATNLINTNLAGVYVDVPGATPPYTNFTTNPASFYRLRCN